MFAAKNELFTRPSGYTISRSVRLRSSASAYFNRTPAGAGTSNKTFTYSAWVKRGSLGSIQNLISSPNTGNSDSLRFSAADALEYNWQDTVVGQVTTTQVFRDPSAWYHIMFAMDTTQATASNRFKLYVNGVQVTAFSTANYPAQNTAVNNTAAVATKLGQYANSSTQNFDGYLTEINFIDGQALTPTSFGQFNSVTGVWQPLKYTGTYGTNGFYLNFSDNSNNTATTIGKDYSGNGNNWTPNNISVTSGSTYDSMLDVPTLYADGGNGRGNYCTLNPVFKNANSTYGVMATPISGNLESSMGAGTNLYGTQGLFGNKGKWYAECRPSSIVSQVSIGYLSDDGNLNRGAWINSSSGVLVDNVSKGTAGFATGNTIGIAYDSINNTVQFYVNGSAVGSAYSTSTGSFNEYLFWSYTNSGVYVEWNFGQRPFAYTPPSGYVALNTQNLPAPTISNGALYMAATTYTGNGASRSITNGGNNTIGTTFQPDLVWIKSRSTVGDTEVYDSVRGATKYLLTDATTVEGTIAQSLTAFNSNGFSLGTGSGGNDNTNGTTYIGWQWQAGAGTTSSNTSGSITSTVSVNATAGFSIVTYTGTGANATVGHGLGVAPSMIIIKCRGSATDPSWIVGHVGVVMGTGRLILNGTDANSNAGAASLWNSTAATSTVFSLGNYSSVNQSTLTYVAYCFSAVRGYSAFGSYTGNGSTDGPFVFLGFRPRWVMIKRTDTAGNNWVILDTSRDTYNASGLYLYPNLSAAEDDYRASTGPMDILSNGFKQRSSLSNVNASGATYIYACFAENPFKLALAR